MRRAARIDDNQNELVAGLRKYPGVTVKVTSQLKKFCDIVVGFRGKNYLIEIKDPSKPPSHRQLTPDEKIFHDLWTGQVDIAHTVDEVLKIINYPKQTFKLTK